MALYNTNHPAYTCYHDKMGNKMSGYLYNQSEKSYAPLLDEGYTWTSNTNVVSTFSDLIKLFITYIWLLDLVDIKVTFDFFGNYFSPGKILPSNIL